MKQLLTEGPGGKCQYLDKYTFNRHLHKFEVRKENFLKIFKYEDRWKARDKGRGESGMGSCLASASSFLRAVFSSLSSCIR